MDHSHKDIRRSKRLREEFQVRFQDLENVVFSISTYPFGLDASLTVYYPNGANAPRYRGCLSAICYGTETIKMTKP